MKRDIKQEIISMITEKMASSSQLPWDKGLLNSPFLPVNGKSMKRYRGINLMLLAFLGSGTQEYMTFNQVKEAGGTVKKGAKSLPVVYWNKWNKVEKRPAEQDDDPEDCYFFLKRYNVFNVGEQTEGINVRRQIKTRDNQRNAEVDEFIKKFFTATKLTLEENSSTQLEFSSAYYMPAKHLVSIAPINEYKSSESWIATIFHEMVHSTGKAMGREYLPEQSQEQNYSQEEIVAEFGAALLCREFGITKEDNNTAAYIQGWSAAIKENPDWLINGANAAQKAVDYMLEITGYQSIEE